jgi:hypothetical protein
MRFLNPLGLSVSGLLACMMVLTHSAFSHELLKLEPNAGHVPSKYGAPSGGWKTIAGWSPKNITLTCWDPDDSKRDNKDCPQWDVTNGPRIEKAGRDAMHWLEKQGLPSPELLGPVVTPNASGSTESLLVFTGKLDNALAQELSCRENLSEGKAVALQWNVPDDEKREFPKDKDGKKPDDVTDRPAETILADETVVPQWALQGIFAHELSHAIQDSAFYQAAGYATACDPRNVYSRAPFLFEGLADFVKNTYIRWHLLKGEKMRYPIRDIWKDRVLGSGLTASQYAKYHGWAAYRQGLFNPSIAYQTSSFFRHLSERYLDGSVLLHNAFFSPDDASHPASDRDIVRWFEQKLGLMLGTGPLGPTLTLAYADIASWPDTSFDGRTRLETEPSPPGHIWRDYIASCQLRELTASEPVKRKQVDIAPYGVRCLDIAIEDDRAEQNNVHAQIYIEASARSLREADGLHLGIVQVMEGVPPHPENKPETETSKAKSIEIDFGIAKPWDPEKRLFSCAATLDALKDESIEKASKHCMPVRDGPIRQANGRYVVRWTLPTPMLRNSVTTSAVLAYVPARDTRFGPQVREAYTRLSDAKVRVGTSLRLAADLDKTPFELAQSIEPKPVPEVSPCDEAMAMTRIARINAITRSFGVADWNAFDFPDDIRSDLNSELGRERSPFIGQNVKRSELAGRSGGALHFTVAAAAYAHDVDMLEQFANPLLSNEETGRRIDAFRDQDDVVLGFSLETSEYGYCNGFNDDDPSASKENEVEYFVFFSEFEGERWKGFRPKRWGELSVGSRYPLQVHKVTHTSLSHIGLGETLERGSVDVLERGDDWVRLRFVITSDDGANRNFEVVLPALEYFTWDSRRELVQTKMQAFYLERWRNEQQFEYRGREADPFGRIIENKITVPQSQAGAGSNSACSCSCGALSQQAIQFEELKRAPDNFLRCSARCCSSYLSCPSEGRESVAQLKKICEW